MPPLCHDACVFAKDGRGGRARVRGSHGLCVFCDPDRLAGALRLLASRRSVFGVLRSWRCVGSPVYDFAWRASALVTLPADDLRALRSEVEGGPSFLCRGLRFDGAPLSPCQFARDGEGGRARVHGADACVFCDVAAVKAALNAPLSRRAVVAALRGWFARGSDTYDFAWVASSLSFLPDVVVRSLRAEVEDGFCDGLRCGELLLAPCQFAPDGRGGRARSRGARACIFCDAAAMEAALGAGTSRWRVVCVLRHWMRSELPSYAAAWVGSALAFLSDDDQEQLRAEVTHTHGAAKRAAALADSARRVSRRRCSTAAAASSGRPSGSAMVARGNAQQTLEAWVRDAEPLALDAQRRAVMARPGTFRACRVCGTPRWVPNFAPGRLRCWMPQAALPPGALPYAQCRARGSASVWRRSAPFPAARVLARGAAVLAAASASGRDGVSGTFWDDVRSLAAGVVPAEGPLALPYAAMSSVSVSPGMHSSNFGLIGDFYPTIRAGAAGVFE
jgi:hypothetical protein